MVNELKAKRYVTLEELKEYLGDATIIYGIYYDWQDRTWVLECKEKWPKEGTDKIEIYHFSSDESLVIFETDLKPETITKVMELGGEYIARHLTEKKEEEGINE